jgi:hypothetical protein
MITIANFFIVGLLGIAAAVGAAAMVEKRAVRRRKETERSSNAAS